MIYKPGQIIAKFTSKKNKEIVFRIPKLGWEKEYQDYINSIIAEDDYILYEKPLDIKDEKKFIKSKMEEIKGKKGFCITAFYKDKIIGNTDLKFGKGREKHVALFGIAIKNGFREEGIGTKMMEILFSKAKTLGIKVIELKVFETNTRAINSYKKMGFKKSGSIPGGIYHRGKYISDNLMCKNL